MTVNGRTGGLPEVRAQGTTLPCAFPGRGSVCGPHRNTLGLGDTSNWRHMPSVEMDGEPVKSCHCAGPAMAGWTQSHSERLEGLEVRAGRLDPVAGRNSCKCPGCSAGFCHAGDDDHRGRALAGSRSPRTPDEDTIREANPPGQICRCTELHHRIVPPPIQWAAQPSTRKGGRPTHVNRRKETRPPSAGKTWRTTDPRSRAGPRRRQCLRKEEFPGSAKEGGRGN